MCVRVFAKCRYCWCVFQRWVRWCSTSTEWMESYRTSEQYSGCTRSVAPR